MPSNRRRIIYWDTNIFLAWLKGEQQEPDVEEGIQEAVQRVNDNLDILITSVIVDTEILESSLSDNARQKWADMFKRRNIKKITFDQRIAAMSGSIRDYYKQRSVKLSSLDSIHLATAIIYEANIFYTLDGAGRRSRPNDLIQLSGNVSGHNLVICKPKARPKPPPTSTEQQVGLFEEQQEEQKQID